ncbi:MAG: rhodanese-like domain-containing protein [Phycisphaerales bacterium]
MTLPLCSIALRPQSLRPLLVGLLTVAMSLLLGGCTRDVTDGDIRDMAVTRVVKLRDAKAKNGLLIIDARSAKEFAATHIPDARNCPVESISGRVGDLDPALSKFEYLVVYGDDPGSNQAKVVSKKLMTSGYDGVYMFRGGLMEWIRAGQPVSGTNAPPK